MTPCSLHGGLRSSFCYMLNSLPLTSPHALILNTRHVYQNISGACFCGGREVGGFNIAEKGLLWPGVGKERKQLNLTS